MSKFIKLYALCHFIVCHSTSIKLFLFLQKMRGLVFCVGNGEESTLEKHMQKLIKEWICNEDLSSKILISLLFDNHLCLKFGPSFQRGFRVLSAGPQNQKHIFKFHMRHSPIQIRASCRGRGTWSSLGHTPACIPLGIHPRPTPHCPPPLHTHTLQELLAHCPPPSSAYLSCPSATEYCQ